MSLSRHHASSRRSSTFLGRVAHASRRSLYRQSLQLGATLSLSSIVLQGYVSTPLHRVVLDRQYFAVPVATHPSSVYNVHHPAYIPRPFSDASWQYGRHLSNVTAVTLLSDKADIGAHSCELTRSGISACSKQFLQTNRTG